MSSRMTSRTSLSTKKDSVPSFSNRKELKKERRSKVEVEGQAEDEAPEEKDSALTYLVLPKADTDEILQMSVTEMESKLQEMFHLSPLTDLKDAAILDYYVGATYWGKEQGFTSAQLSTFFSLIHKLLFKITDEHASLVDLMLDFRKMLVGIGDDTQLPSSIEKGGLECFSTKQGKDITDYLYSSLFQHYRLYEFMFTYPQTEEIITSDLSVEVPPAAAAPFPPPLDEGISEETYTNFLSLPTPSLSEAEESRTGEDTDAKPMTPLPVEVPPEMEDLFSKLTPEDVKNIIEEVSSELLSNLQLGVESKLRTQENQVLGRINKVHNVPPVAPAQAASETLK